MTRESLMQNPRFLEFLQRVQEEFERLQPQTVHRPEALQSEVAQLELRCRGWAQSLGNPALASSVRHAIEGEYEQAQRRIWEIKAELSQLAQDAESRRRAIDPEQVADQLMNLAEILARGNPSAANLVLSQHIDAIACDRDGKVVIRTCRLGALAGGLELVPRSDQEPGDEVKPDDGGAYRATPRRRGRLEIGAAVDDADAAAAANEFAVDPHRFAGFGAEWFAEDVFHVPRRLCWSEEHAREVAEYRLKHRASMPVTAQHFHVTVPTIRAALGYARDLYGIDAFGTTISAANRPNWPRDNAQAVAEFFGRPKATMKEAQAHFGKSQPWISRARQLAREAEAAQRSADAEPSASMSAPNAKADSPPAFREADQC